MRELQISVSDDLTYSLTGERVPAEETILLSLDGQTRELDLTSEHATELRELLSDYLKAGHTPGEQPSKPGEAERKPHRSVRRPPDLKTGRARMAKLRDWVDENHVRGLSGPDRPAYLTTTGKNYAPDWLLKAYANAMAQRGEHDEWIDRWADA